MLIILSGLPGVGKTTIARGLANALGAVHVRIDSMEQALRNMGVNVTGEGYAVGQAVSEDNLRLGRIVIADCVNPDPEVETTGAQSRNERVSIRWMSRLCAPTLTSTDGGSNPAAPTFLGTDCPCGPTWLPATTGLGIGTGFSLTPLASTRNKA